ncbi:ribonuclease P protein subunit p40 [Aplochiton taeniatus]
MFQVSLLLPACRTLTSQLSSVINSFHNYYLIRSLPVYELLDKTFLDFVLNGATYALSYKTQIDQDNTFALIPDGHLILSVDKDTYEQLGLEGKPSHFIHRRPMRYVVTIDLTDKTMAPGEKSYQRVLTSLKGNAKLKSDFLLAQHNSGAQKDGALLSFPPRYQWTEHKPEVKISFLKDVLCPALYSSDLKGSTQSCDPQPVLEWLGAVNTGVSCDNTASRFLSTYVCPEPNIAESQALQCTISGFLMPHDIYTLVQELGVGPIDNGIVHRRCRHPSTTEPSTVVTS